MVSATVAPTVRVTPTTIVGSVAMFEDLNRILTVHQIKPIVDRVFPFDDALAFLPIQPVGEPPYAVAVQVDGARSRDAQGFARTS